MIGMLHGQVDSIDAVSAIIEVGGVAMRPGCSGGSGFHARRSNGEGVHVVERFAGCDHAVWLFLARIETYVPAITEGQWHWPEGCPFLAFDVAPERLARAVADGDATALAKAPGLGKKGAQKIILELKGSIDLSQIEGASPETRSTEDTGSEQVVEGLMSLGWRQQDAVHAVQDVCESNHIDIPLGDDDVPRVLKLALASLDRGR